MPELPIFKILQYEIECDKDETRRETIRKYFSAIRQPIGCCEQDSRVKRNGLAEKLLDTFIKKPGPKGRHD